MLNSKKIACRYTRPAGKRPDLVILEVDQDHEYAGATIICNCYGQEYLTKLNPGDRVWVKDKLREADSGDFLGDACPDFMQPMFPGRKEPDPVSQLEIDSEQEPVAEVTILPPAREEDAGFTYTIKEIDLRSYEHKKIFEKYYAQYGTKKEAARQLIVFAIETLKRASSQDLDIPDLS